MWQDVEVLDEDHGMLKDCLFDYPRCFLCRYLDTLQNIIVAVFSVMRPCCSCNKARQDTSTKQALSLIVFFLLLSIFTRLLSVESRLMKGLMRLSERGHVCLGYTCSVV